MGSYVVQRAYRARRDEHTLGPWAAGDVVELDDATAEWLERDSPGLLTPPTPEPEPEPEPVERQAAKPRDRQARGGRNRGA